MNYKLATSIEILLSSNFWEFMDQFVVFLETITEMTEKEFIREYGKRGFIDIKFDKARFKFTFRTAPGKVLFTDLERIK